MKIAGKSTGKRLKNPQLDAFIRDVKGISSHKDDVEDMARAYASAETFEKQSEKFNTRAQEEIKSTSDLED